MSSFSARLRLPGRNRIPLGVEVDIFNEQMTLTSGERTVANWPLDKLDVVARPDGFHIRVDGEEMILNVPERNRFAAEIGTGKRPQPSTTDQPGEQERPPDFQRRVSDVAIALTSDALSPAEAFSQWLSLLKELHRRHRQGTITSEAFHRLSAELLDLIPDPTPLSI